ncbi:hypothetical protein [Pseudomonas asiatica]|uniref:hypothetical protein n=1 Tax=Pseudomonas asiatica TaxID=2219225 RepID=UPI0010C0251F|nr:hypothetical protein [Pseudomonas asiatica]
MTMNNAYTFQNIPKALHGFQSTVNGLPGLSYYEIAEITSKDFDEIRREVSEMLREIGSDQAPVMVLDKTLALTFLISQSRKLPYRTAYLIVCRLCQLEWEV